MPIKFRCRHCRQFLGISRARAGEITDCPMCGKTIRVPNLDGSIEPIPSPELDLEDSQLVAALGELAGIGKPPSPTEVTSAPKVMETHDATVIAPAAEPVPRPPAMPARPVRAATPGAGDSETIIQAAEDGATVIGSEDPLRALADSAIRLSLPRPPQRWQTDRRSIWLMGLSATAVLGFAAVIWFGGGHEPQLVVQDVSAEESAPSVKPVDASPAGPAVAQPVGQEGAAVGGQVTYLSEGGDAQPDSGARILLLPKLKRGTVKLDVAGFLAGAETVDADVARAAIRALGGDVATVGEDGRYELLVGNPGDYHLLAISRHSSRESTSSVTAAIQDALTPYFFRPASLLGSLSVRFEEFHHTGQATAPHDFNFANE